jgi:hypothetical protein
MSAEELRRAQKRSFRGMSIATLEDVETAASRFDLLGHHWSGEPAHEFFKAAALLRQASGELFRLRKVIEDAPHTASCNSHVIRFGLRGGAEACDCWKASAVGTKSNDSELSHG